MARRRALTICSVPGCPEYTDQGGRCAEHRHQAEQRRGTARQRGYGREHEKRFRTGVLRRDPVCTCHGCTSCVKSGNGRCTRESQHADHWPQDRRALVAASLDPDDPQYGRGLCGSCHSYSTAREQPGGWNK